MQPGTHVEVPLVGTATQGTETLEVESVQTITDSDGDHWYWIHAKHADNSPATVIAEIDHDDIDLSIVTENLKLRDIDSNPKSIWKFADQGQGVLVYQGQQYHYDDDASGDGTLSAPHTPDTDISFYRFDSKLNADLSLLLIQWPNDRFDVLALRIVNSAAVHLK